MLRKISLTALAAVSVAGWVGCNTEPLAVKQQKPQGPVTRMEAPEGVDVPDIAVTDQQESDIVENLLLHRAMYKKTLLVLRDYYRDTGYAAKQRWAEQELKDLERVRPYKYLMSAEVPSKKLRGTDRVTEADSLYDQGLSLMKKGGAGVPMFYRRDIMKQALDCFQELVEAYPNSDKIDDAAFYIGEILKEYFKDQERLAVVWYERSKEWNPQTPHPVCFQSAVVYDYRLHDRDKALEWYDRVLKDEPWEESNRSFASRRIYQLTRDRDRSRDLEIPYQAEPASAPAKGAVKANKAGEAAPTDAEPEEELYEPSAGRQTGTAALAG